MTNRRARGLSLSGEPGYLPSETRKRSQTQGRASGGGKRMYIGGRGWLIVIIFLLLLC